jgi:hypothetical protein
MELEGRRQAHPNLKLTNSQVTACRFGVIVEDHEADREECARTPLETHSTVARFINKHQQAVVILNRIAGQASSQFELQFTVYAKTNAATMTNAEPSTTHP